MVELKSIVGSRGRLYYEGKSSLSHIADPHLRIVDEKKPPIKIQNGKYKILTSLCVSWGAREGFIYYEEEKLLKSHC